MGLRGKFGGELWWTLSLAVYGEGDAPLSLLVPLECGCGRISGKGGRHSQAFLGLRWGMGLGPNFGMIYGAEIQFLRKLFLFYLVLLVRRMPLLKIIWSFWAISISGT